MRYQYLAIAAVNIACAFIGWTYGTAPIRYIEASCGVQCFIAGFYLYKFWETLEW